ncbi:MAG: hypothetical protein Q9213_001012 [Squamulea squamosa]
MHVAPHLAKERGSCIGSLQHPVPETQRLDNYPFISINRNIHSPTRFNSKSLFVKDYVGAELPQVTASDDHAAQAPFHNRLTRQQVEIQPGLPVGSASRGTPLNVVPMTGGTAISHPSFSPSVDAVFAGQGNDYIRNDPSGNHMRLDAHAVLKNKGSDNMFYVHYTGVIELTSAETAILSGSPDAKTTEFGNAFINLHFETGDESLKDLETGVFVGAGRFVIEKDRPTTVEYRISKVVRG